jgi:hypothetical protein
MASSLYSLLQYGIHCADIYAGARIDLLTKFYLSWPLFFK